MAGRRRGFESDGLDLDLIVWYDVAGAVTGFQLCYDFGKGEHALTWREGAGFSYSIIDSGDYSPFKNRAPVLEEIQGEPPWADLCRIFDDRAEMLAGGAVELHVALGHQAIGSGRAEQTDAGIDSEGLAVCGAGAAVHAWLRRLQWIVGEDASYRVGHSRRAALGLE